MFQKFLILLFCFLLFMVGYSYAGPLEDCAEYTVVGVPSVEGTLLCRKGYLLAHNSDNKTPNWVIEHLTFEKVSSKEAKRSNNFAPDPDLTKGERAELNDYRNSGFDKGHMAPSADMEWDQQAMNECFYLSNMVPQVGKGMNRDIWSHLERMIRDSAMHRKELYVITGPIYHDTPHQTIGNDNVSVPTHLFKIAYDPKTKEAIAFIMPNASLNLIDMPKYIVTINEVEQETHLIFLRTLDEASQIKVKNTKSEALWQ